MNHIVRAASFVAPLHFKRPVFKLQNINFGDVGTDSRGVEADVCIFFGPKSTENGPESGWQQNRMREHLDL